ncbi:MAG TPA: A/G-specific adenine glycosylase [Spirochaetia bacterium]|nr:A/G-specific adenine glycosylase [Spirochaetia bacterium]
MPGGLRTSPGPDEVKRFRQLIWNHFHTSGRKFPWRETDDPYEILISEFMLQQTQTDRVLPYYSRFVEKFPGIEALAAASLKEVIQLWQGLGYNRRARFLHETAGIVVRDFDGKIPCDPAMLRRFPGVGPGTAGAVAVFACRRPEVFIETNIRRVFIHLFFGNTERVADQEILPLVGLTLDRDNPREWYYALMDYGVHIQSLFTNPNRRSTHYTRQARFENSNRQLRGKVVRALAARESARLVDLSDEIGSDDERIVKVLADLVREGMVVREEATGTYRIP